MKLQELFESKTGNEGRGYHGEWDSQEAAAKFKDMHARVRKITGAAEKEATHYLDSVHGRHVADIEKDDDDVDSYIVKDFKRFKKTYKPEHFED